MAEGPKVCSEWNREKGASDAAAKSIEFCPAHLPVASAQAEIVTRLVLGACSCFKRC